MKAFYLILLVAVWAAGFSNARRRQLDLESSCEDECQKGKACMKLEKVKPKKKVKKCIDYIQDTCEDADDVTKCLASLVASMKGGCSKRISRVAVPCLTCEYRCYELHGNDGDEDSDGYGSDSESDDDDEEECIAQCEETRACKFVVNLSAKKKQGCSEFADQYCDDEVSLSCFMAMKKQADKRCPFGIRNKAIACWRCEERCDNDVHPAPVPTSDEDDDDDDDDDDEVDSACHADCTASTSCKNFDASKEANVPRCRALAMTNCNYDIGEGASESEVINCFEKITTVADEKCSQSFRQAAIECLKCDQRCEAVVSTTYEEGQVMEGGDNDDDKQACVDQCGETRECMHISGLTSKMQQDCNNFTNVHCGDNFSSECFAKTKNILNTKCPSATRDQAFVCLRCQESCQSGDYSRDTDRNDVPSRCDSDCDASEICQTVQKMTSTNVPMMCEALADTQCNVSFANGGTAKDFVGCLERIKNVGDEICTQSFRFVTIACSKCHHKCERDATMSTCQRYCSQTEPCMAVNTEPELTLRNCDNLIEKICGISYTSVEECMGNSTVPDDGCPVAFRRQIAGCVKCEKMCEQKILTSQTKSCVAACENSSACTENDGASPACGDCVKNICRASASDVDCTIGAIAGACRNICVTSISPCMNCKDDCIA